MNFVGIDPGATGAVAVIDNDGAFLALFDMPMVEKDLQAIELCAFFDTIPVPARVALEYQQPWPGQLHASTAVQDFRLGMTYGGIIACLQVCRLTYELARPANWKPSMGVAGSDKEKSRGMAHRLWPDLAATELKWKKDHGRAEALLLAEYLRRREGKRRGTRD